MATPYETYLRRYLNDSGQLWDSLEIERYANEAQIEIAKVAPFVVRRLSLGIIKDEPLYTVTKESLGIQQITYFGKAIVAITRDQLRSYFPDYVIASTGPAILYGGSSSVPRFWLYSGYAVDKIQLIPTPNQNVALYVGSESELWSREIATRCIVEYKAIPETGSSINQPMARFQRLLIRDWVLYRAFAKEGRGQQLTQSEYAERRFQARLKIIESLFRTTFISNRARLSAQVTARTPYNLAFNPGDNIGRPVPW